MTLTREFFDPIGQRTYRQGRKDAERELRPKMIVEIIEVANGKNQINQIAVVELANRTRYMVAMPSIPVCMK